MRLPESFCRIETVDPPRYRHLPAQSRRGGERQAQEDVISHLLSQNYTDAEILTECITYAAAGMVTTREFISVAAWHFLERPELRDRYLATPEEERLEMLHETLRLEPVVGNLYRRATADNPAAADQITRRRGARTAQFRHL